MCFFFFLIQLKRAPKKTFPLICEKKFTETTDLAKTCADLFLHSPVTGFFRPHTPIHTETELKPHVMLSAQLPSSNTRQCLGLLLMLH